MTANLYLGGSPLQVSNGDAAGSGTYNLGGTGSLTASSEYIGYSGTGTFNQTGGTNTVSYQLIVGQNPGSSGTYNLNDGTLSGAQYIGRFGIGTFTQNGGTNTAAASFWATAPEAAAL